MDMEITFPGKKRVSVLYGGYVIETDQPADSGGEASSPTPFDLFIASIGACAGVYALNFCQGRKIPTGGMKVHLKADYSQQEKRVTSVKLEINLPPGFPPEYRDALVRSVELCTVKRNIQRPPEFSVTLV
jgi:putative redox protein